MCAGWGVLEHGKEWLGVCVAWHCACRSGVCVGPVCVVAVQVYVRVSARCAYVLVWCVCQPRVCVGLACVSAACVRRPCVCECECVWMGCRMTWCALGSVWHRLVGHGAHVHVCALVKHGNVRHGVCEWRGEKGPLKRIVSVCV